MRFLSHLFPVHHFVLLCFVWNDLLSGIIFTKKSQSSYNICRSMIDRGSEDQDRNDYLLGPFEHGWSLRDVYL